jgi:hypothetical protein
VIRFWFALFAATAMGQTPRTFCDADLIRQTNPRDVDRYMDRGGRCEGLYAEQVSLTGNLLVASLTTGSVTPDAWSGQPLRVLCRYRETADVHIQAFLLQPRPFYRLDVMQRGSSIAWTWNTEVIARYGKSVNVGIVAWTSVLIDGQARRVYLPLRSPVTRSSSSMKLIILPPVAVSEAYVTIASTRPGEKPFRRQAPVGKGSYLRNERIEIEVPPLPHEGLYRIDVNGRSEIGSVSAPEFFIYNAGK